MFGLSIKNIEVSNITVNKTKDKYAPADGLIISVKLKFKYKNKNKELVFKFNTYDGVIFGFGGAINHNHVDKAEFIIKQFNKKTLFIRSIIEKKYKEFLSKQYYTKTEKELLEKFQAN